LVLLSEEELKHNPLSWKPYLIEHQHSYWGSTQALMSDDEIEAKLIAQIK